MGDLYFNELSVDFTFSVAPKDETEAKKLLLQFIQTFFAYKVCTGLDDVYILSIVPMTINRITNAFNPGKFYSLIDDLELEDKITEEQKRFFKATISEAFKSDWNPEYLYSNQIAYGLGQACLKNSFSISFSTDIANTTHTWNQYLTPIEEHRLNENGDLVIIKKVTKNLTSKNHVVVNHEIWKDCSFINNKPIILLLPNKNQSFYIVQSITGKNWIDYYASQQQVNITIKRIIGRAVARINGWIECATTDHRLTFKAGNHYLAIDTENSTFEVYNGTNNHKGEIKFYDETINTAKADPMRRVTLR